MNQQLLAQAAAAYRTPLYVYDIDDFQKRIHGIQSMLSDDQCSIGLTYSMKANPFMVSYAAEEVERIEVCSFGEFMICRELGIPARKLLLSGVLKKEEDILDMVSFCRNEAIYTAESPLQLQMLEKAAETYDAFLPVLLRLSSGNQFGMDQRTITDVVRTRMEYTHLEILGLHFFSGTGKKNLKKVTKELCLLDQFVSDLQYKADFETRMIEYGTGFAVPYFKKDQETITPTFMAQFQDLVKQMHYHGKITVEMGRAIAYDCGTYLTQVMDVKQTENTTYCIVDGGIHQLNYDGQIRGMYQPSMEVIPGQSDTRQDPPIGMAKNAADSLADGTMKRFENVDSRDSTCMICGSLCTVNDVLVADYKGQSPQIGDVLVFHNTGAYSINEGMSTFLSHELVQVMTYSEKSGFQVVRREQPSWKLNLCQAASHV